eukprot:scaffold22.g6080.t1
MPSRCALLALVLALFLCEHLCSAEGLRLSFRRSAVEEADGEAGDGGAAAAGTAAATATNSTGRPKETIAQILDEALHEEFKHEEEKKADVGKTFNETATQLAASSEVAKEATQETVIIISKSKAAANRTAEAAAAAANSTAAAAAAAGAAGAGGAAGAAGGGAAAAGAGGGATRAADDAGAVAANATAGDAAATAGDELDLDVETDVDRIIDSKDNEYVLSKPNEEGSMGLNLDPAFVRDLTTLVGASALAGLAMEAAGQPTINGYLLAGSVVGPGGLNLVKELVQVQSASQLGVQLLLFTLGLEFSLAKLRAVRSVALLGGLLQMALCSALAGIGAKLIGSSVYQGVFVGAVVAMSSTSIVVKVLNDARSANSQQGQITIGTLILQDCMVGLLFAFMPVLSSGSLEGAFQLGKLLAVAWRVAAKLAVVAAVAAVAARAALPPLARGLARHFSGEVFQLVVLAFCFLASLITQRQEAALHQLQPVSRFFLALFIASTGLVLSPRFLLHHLPVLAAGVMVVIIAKTGLVAGVVSMFGYPADTALAVGLNLAQIGEFAFVLLSVARQLQLVDSSVYLLLMGVTALSLLVTPLLLQLSLRVLPRVRSSAHLASLGGGGEVDPGSARALLPLTARPGGAGAPGVQQHLKQQQQQHKAHEAKQAPHDPPEQARRPGSLPQLVELALQQSAAKRHASGAFDGGLHAEAHAGGALERGLDRMGSDLVLKMQLHSHGHLPEQRPTIRLARHASLDAAQPGASPRGAG